MQTHPLPLKDRYHKVALKNVSLWEPCDPSDAEEWIAPETEGDKPYPVRPIHLMEASAPHLFVIVQPDGALWPEGSLYLFEKIAHQGDKQATVSNAASDLCDFMNKLYENDKNFLDFDGPKFKRPTYFYKSELKRHIMAGNRTRGYCNRQLGSVQGMYKWLASSRGFKPKQDMWASKSRFVNYVDKYGFPQAKEVITTDLTFRNAQKISSGRFIRDGGNLVPISRENQQRLVDVLVELGNPEMLLIHIVGLTTGMRIQSNLTLRHRAIKSGVGHESDDNKFALYGIEMGGALPTEAKNSKEQTVRVPAWVHHMLDIYIKSPRHLARAKLSPIKNDDDQYVFLTRTGKPYYTAETDQHLFDYSSEKGSALRQYCRKVIKLMKEKDAEFSYHMHDLRATFAMNLITDDMKNRDNGKMNQIDLLENLKNRLNQEDIEVTLRYLNYYEEHPQINQAQSDYELHLESLIRTEMLKNEPLRQDLRTPPPA